jgi:hypothetical protein
MKKQSILGVFGLGLVMLIGSAPAHAQDAGKVTLFGGYSYLTRGNSTCIALECEDEVLFGSAGLHGYDASVVYHESKHIGFEANFSGHNGSPDVFSEPATAEDSGEALREHADFYTYTFGPNVSTNLGHFTVFSHFLVGAAHIHQGFSAVCSPATSEPDSCDETDTENVNMHGNGFAFKAGGGVDWNHGRWGLRVLELDYVRISSKVTETENEDGSNVFGPATLNTSSNNMSLSAGVTFSFRK